MTKHTLTIDIPEGWTLEQCNVRVFSDKFGAIEAEGKSLKDAKATLVRTIKMYEASKTQARGEDDDARIIALCEKHGFGYVMQIAQEEWKRRDPIGCLTIGPCPGMETPPEDFRMPVNVRLIPWEDGSHGVAFDLGEKSYAAELECPEGFALVPTSVPHAAIDAFHMLPMNKRSVQEIYTAMITAAQGEKGE